MEVKRIESIKFTLVDFEDVKFLLNVLKEVIKPKELKIYVRPIYLRSLFISKDYNGLKVKKDYERQEIVIKDKKLGKIILKEQVGKIPKLSINGSTIPFYQPLIYGKSEELIVHIWDGKNKTLRFKRNGGGYSGLRGKS